jgi:hypothetical protein
MIRVKFDSRGSGLASRSPGELKGFQIAGADGVYRYAKATIEGSDVVVDDPQTPEPKTVRYAWGASPQADLINAEGLPAGPFRTDDAPIALTPELRAVPPQHHLTTAAYDIVINGDGSVSSLVVGGKQFLANNNGGGGAAHFAGGFGPRQLLYVTPISENKIQFSDAQLSIVFSFADDSMKWTIKSHGGPATFQMDMAANVKVSVPADGHASCNFDLSKLEIDGVDSVRRGFGATIEAKVAQNGTRVITLHVSGKSH